VGIVNKNRRFFVPFADVFVCPGVALVLRGLAKPVPTTEQFLPSLVHVRDAIKPRGQCRQHA